jgi:hypothetical protein
MPMDYTNEVNTRTKGMSPSLTNQTPGMDAEREVRDIAMRQLSWLRENRGFALGLLGGICAIGLGAWLIVRARRPSRMDMLRAKGSDLADWFRSKMW